MATYTSHYNLKKPATSDKIRIADFNGNADTIDSTMYDNESLIAKLKADIGIVENTNTATHNISAGQYVIWKGSLYTASSAISSGATLSDANLTAVSGGGLNALNDNIVTLNNQAKMGTSTATTGSTGAVSVDYPSGFNNTNSIMYAYVYQIDSRNATKLITNPAVYYNSAVTTDGLTPNTEYTFLFRSR